MLPTNRVRRFKILAEEHRLRILEVLLDRPSFVSQLADRLAIEQSLLSHHLGVLRKEGLVISRRWGKKIYYELSPHILDDTINPSKLLLGCCDITLHSR